MLAAAWKGLRFSVNYPRKTSANDVAQLVSLVDALRGDTPISTSKFRLLQQAVTHCIGMRGAWNALQILQACEKQLPPEYVQKPRSIETLGIKAKVQELCTIGAAYHALELTRILAVDRSTFNSPEWSPYFHHLAAKRAFTPFEQDKPGAEDFKHALLTGTSKIVEQWLASKEEKFTPRVRDPNEPSAFAKAFMKARGQNGIWKIDAKDALKSISNNWAYQSILSVRNKLGYEATANAFGYAQQIMDKLPKGLNLIGLGTNAESQALGRAVLDLQSASESKAIGIFPFTSSSEWNELSIGRSFIKGPNIIFDWDGTSIDSLTAMARKNVPTAWGVFDSWLLNANADRDQQIRAACRTGDCLIISSKTYRPGSYSFEKDFPEDATLKWLSSIAEQLDLENGSLVPVSIF